MADLVFDQFRFDTANECLWRGSEMITLTPKSYAVLRRLLEHPGQLVSKDELLDAVWPRTAVSDASLKVCIQEIRRALGDRVASPRFIATVHRRGYRFIAAVEAVAPPASAAEVAAPADAGATPPAPVAEPAPRAGAGDLVGRDAEFGVLRAAFERALQGEQRVVFVTGELGIGKTTLVDAFLADVAVPAGATVARGRCLEHFGTGEAYLPLLEALGRLCREQAASGAVTLLRERAPSWLAQMPWLIADADREALHHEIFGGTRERMLRELGEALRAFAAQRPLVLVLEDLHWSDPSTLDAVALLAQQHEPAPLLVLATYRPVDAILASHPVKDLKQRLTLQGNAAELALTLLSTADVGDYLAARLAASAPSGLADVVHRRTDGNALFTVMVVDDLLAGSRLKRAGAEWVLSDGLEAVAAAVPDGVRQMVEVQIERLTPDTVALLETAALARGEFSAALVGTALDADPLAIEQRCEELARQQQWIRTTGMTDLPDGTVSGTYGFTHRLYQSVFAQRVPPARSMRLHQRIGEWLEHTAGDRAALELAMHFEQSRDPARAIRYLRAAARIATARCAHREAVAELTHALGLVERLPEAERGAARRALLERRGRALQAMGDIAAAVDDLSAWEASARADGAGAETVRALLAASAAWWFRDRARGLALAEEAAERSRNVGDPDLHLQARAYTAYSFARVHGWRPGDAQAAADAVATFRRRKSAGLLAAHLGMHAYFANLQGQYPAAAAGAAEGAALAEPAGESFAHQFCQYQQGWALLHAGDSGALLRVLHGALGAAERNEHRLWALIFKLMLAWWAAQTGDSARAAPRADDCLTAARAAGHEYGTLFGLLVSGWAELGRGAVTAARDRFDALSELAARQAELMEWVLHLPLHLGRSACALAAREPRAAAREAERVCELAAQPGERTYLALGHRARAAAAIAERRWPVAEEALAAARGALDGTGTTLATWQVWHAAARLAEAIGHKDEAAQHRRRCTAALDEIAARLGGVDAALADELGVSISATQNAIRHLAD